MFALAQKHPRIKETMAEETKDPKETEPVKAEYIMPKAGEGHWQDTNPTLRWKYFTGVLGIRHCGRLIEPPSL